MRERDSFRALSLFESNKRLLDVDAVSAAPVGRSREAIPLLD